MTDELRPDAHNRAADESGLTPDEAELERRWAEIERQMHEAEYWLGRQGSFVRKVHRGQAYIVLRFRARLKGRRRQCAILIGREDEVELLRRAQSLLRRFRSEAELLKISFRMIQLASRGRRDAERSDPW